MSQAFALKLDRCVLEFRGVDVVRYLNGQLSNDVRKLQPDRAMHACVMTAKGRMNAEVWLTKLPDRIRLDGPAGLGEVLCARFERYIISDDVTVVDVTDLVSLFHVCDSSPETTDKYKATLRSRRFKEEGFDLWFESGVKIASPQTLTPAQAESLRIEQGVPVWGAELDENTIPVEAGLDFDSIDYHKGCYIGQEVISRIKSVGHLNRQLIRLRVSKDSTLAKGAILYAQGQPIGTVTSCAPSLDLENIVALAYVKRAFSAPGTTVASLPDGGETYSVLTLHP